MTTGASVATPKFTCKRVQEAGRVALAIRQLLTAMVVRWRPAMHLRTIKTLIEAKE
jgi:hypothetical protein